MAHIYIYMPGWWFQFFFFNPDPWGDDRRGDFSGGLVPETNMSHLKIDCWKTFSFPFGARPSGRCELLVSGSVLCKFL